MERDDTPNGQLTPPSIQPSSLNPHATPYTPQRASQPITSLDDDERGTTTGTAEPDVADLDRTSQELKTGPDRTQSPGANAEVPTSTIRPDNELAQKVQQAIDRFEQAHQQSTMSSRTTHKYKISQILRRQKMHGKWHYRIKLADTGELLWVLPENILQQDMDQYMNRTNRYRVYRAKATRRH
jgi:hypothetical protein